MSDDFDAWYLRNCLHIVDPARSARLAWFATLAATPAVVEEVRTEEIAAKVYEAMSFEQSAWVPWVRGGNSDAQDHARRTARGICALYTEAIAQPAIDAARFQALQNMPALEAQAYFWHYTSRRERAKAIDERALKAGPLPQTAPDQKGTAA